MPHGLCFERLSFFSRGKDLRNSDPNFLWDYQKCFFMKDSTTKVKIVIKKNWKKGSKNKENMRRTHTLKMETNMKKGRK